MPTVKRPAVMVPPPKVTAPKANKKRTVSKPTNVVEESLNKEEIHEAVQVAAAEPPKEIVYTPILEPQESQNVFKPIRRGSRNVYTIGDPKPVQKEEAEVVYAEAKLAPEQIRPPEVREVQAPAILPKKNKPPIDVSRTIQAPATAPKVARMPSSTRTIQAPANPPRTVAPPPINMTVQAPASVPRTVPAPSMTRTVQAPATPPKPQTAKMTPPKKRPPVQEEEQLVLNREGINTMIGTIVASLSERFVTKQEVTEVVQETLQQMMLNKIG